MTIYLDASFLVSMYSLDVNSVPALHAMQSPGRLFWITTFAEFEFLNALALRVFRKHDSVQQSRASFAFFQRDIQSGLLQVFPLPEDMFLRGRQLSQQTTAQMGTRASDLLHVAAALELGVDGFYTFDRQQRKLAEAMELQVNALD